MGKKDKKKKKKRGGRDDDAEADGAAPAIVDEQPHADADADADAEGEGDDPRIDGNAEGGDHDGHDESAEDHAGDGGAPGGDGGDPEFDVEEHVRNLSKDVSVVEKWTVREVIENFLLPIQMGVYSQNFVDHKVNGAVLIHMDKLELKMIGYDAAEGMKRGEDCNICIGDRVYMNNLLNILRKGKVGVDRDKVIWEVEIPAGSFQYYESFPDMVKYKCCPCCMFHDNYKLTGQGLNITHRPPKFCCFACAPGAVDFNDMRFLKDIDHMEKPKCCCYCYYREAILTFYEGEDNEDDGPDDPNRKPPDVARIRHPLMTEAMMAHMRSVWAELRLVDS